MVTIHELYEDIKIGVDTYSSHLIHSVPVSLWEALLAVLSAGSVVFVAWKGKGAGHYIMRLLLAEYVFMLYYTTIFLRQSKDHVEYNYMPFWSYSNYSFEIQSVMNVIVFIPVGFLIGCSWKNISWWKAILGGCAFSVGIESLQLVLKRGFSEFDDVMHNTLGCIIGFGLFALIRFGYEKVSKRSVAVM